MVTVTKRLYEGMFLVDSAQAGSDWEGVIGAIETVLKRSDAEIVTLRKWDERKMEYEIGRVGRGTYILTYFRVDGQKISAIERDVQLSEKILRVLILNAEKIPQEEVEKETPAEAAVRKAEEEEARKAEAAEKAAAEAEAEKAEESEAKDTEQPQESAEAESGAESEAPAAEEKAAEEKAAEEESEPEKPAEAEAETEKPAE